MSYSSAGKTPGNCAVEPSMSSFTRPTGAAGTTNCPCASVCATTAEATTVAFECSSFVRTARTVTPGMGALLLSSTTPDTVVFCGSPGARPDAVNAAGKPVFDGKFARTTLLMLPSCSPSVSVTAARPSESVSTVTAF